MGQKRDGTRRREATTWRQLGGRRAVTGATWGELVKKRDGARRREAVRRGKWAAALQQLGGSRVVAGLTWGELGSKREGRREAARGRKWAAAGLQLGGSRAVAWGELTKKQMDGARRRAAAIGRQLSDSWAVATWGGLEKRVGARRLEAARGGNWAAAGRQLGGSQAVARR